MLRAVTMLNGHLPTLGPRTTPPKTFFVSWNAWFTLLALKTLLYYPNGESTRSIEPSVCRGCRHQRLGRQEWRKGSEPLWDRKLELPKRIDCVQRRAGVRASMAVFGIICEMQTRCPCTDDMHFHCDMPSC